VNRGNPPSSLGACRAIRERAASNETLQTIDRIDRDNYFRDEIPTKRRIITRSILTPAVDNRDSIDGTKYLQIRGLRAVRSMRSINCGMSLAVRKLQGMRAEAPNLTSRNAKTRRKVMATIK
jgi:hypothetical protein